MALGPGLHLRQTQSLVLTPQLTQAIRLLQLSNLELDAAIAEEIAKNPLLESHGEEDEPATAETSPPAGEAHDGDSPDERGADDLIAAQVQDGGEALDFDWQEAALEVDGFADVDGSAGSGSHGEADFDLERIASVETSLTEHLLTQLHGLSGPLAGIARTIAESLDETGYLTIPLAAIAERLGASTGEAEQALAIVQDLDPPGIAARSLSECLALQARAADRYDPAMARLIDNLEFLARGRMADLKRICGVEDDDLADMIRELRGYDPKPGCRFAGIGAAEVVPDVFVRRRPSGWSVEMNGATLPRLLVNRRYYQELRDGPGDKASRAWLSECLASANWLMKALDQRARTIVKVVSEIVDRQKGFFERGVEALTPLTLREVAEAVDLHESTVSRVTSNKYLLCERGLFELKYFFGSGVASSVNDGEGASAAAVKAAIGAIIEEEEEILSDEQIAGLLKQQGIDVARRTVVKYREAMGIGSSVQRRRRRKIAALG